MSGMYCYLTRHNLLNQSCVQLSSFCDIKPAYLLTENGTVESQTHPSSLTISTHIPENSRKEKSYQDTSSYGNIVEREKANIISKCIIRGASIIDDVWWAIHSSAVASDTEVTPSTVDICKVYWARADSLHSAVCCVAKDTAQSSISRNAVCDKLIDNTSEEEHVRRQGDSSSSCQKHSQDNHQCIKTVSIAELKWRKSYDETILVYIIPWGKVITKFH